MRETRNRLLIQMLVGLLAVPGALVGAGSAVAQDDELDDIARAFGWNFATARISSEPLGGGLHVLFGLGGNVLVSIGSSGVLIVDNQFPQLVPQIRSTIGELGGGAIDFVINTHWHFDHADGNKVLGPAGTWIVAHENSRAMLLEEHVINLVAMEYRQKPYPERARPIITFDDAMRFYFNGEQVELLYFGPAHTTGDTAVFFRNGDAVHLGDVFNNAGYPFIDADNGGDLDGMIHFCREVLARIGSGTRIVPGHGPVAGKETLEAYLAMLETVRGRIAPLVAAGAELDAVVAAEPTAGFDERYGNPAGFINRSYASLLRAHQASAAN